MPPRPRRLGSAHVLAFVALFAALAGGTYAAVRLPRNSVGSAQIRKGAVTPAKLSRAARARLTGKTGPAGAQGVPGAQGTAGTAGAAGTPGATGPSDVYAAGAAAGALTGAYTQVAAITVPAGSYLLEAKTNTYASMLNTSSSVDCIIAPSAAGGAQTWDDAMTTSAAVPTVYAGGVITLVGADTFAAPQTVALACKSIVGANNYNDARVVATRVGSLHGAPLPLD